MKVVRGSRLLGNCRIGELFNWGIEGFDVRSSGFGVIGELRDSKFEVVGELSNWGTV